MPSVPAPRRTALTAPRTAGDQATVVVVGGEPVDLSTETLRTLRKVLHGLASGTEPLLTTTGAADVLGVSRPYLTRLFKAGRLPYRETGNRHPRRVRCGR